MNKKFQKIRENIPALKSQIYVNWGGAGPSPKFIVDKIATYLKWESKIGPFHPKVREETLKIKQTLGVSSDTSFFSSSQASEHLQISQGKYEIMSFKCNVVKESMKQ